MIPRAGRCCDGVGRWPCGKAVRVQLCGSRGSEVRWREPTSTAPPKATLPLSQS